MKKLDRFKRVRIASLGVAIIAGLFFGMLLTLSSIERKVPTAHAADSCLDSSGAPDVAAVQYACSSCGSSSRGTLWFNGSNTEKNSDVVKLTDASATEATIYLWGQVYSCNTTGTSDNNALFIWFGNEGQDTGSGSNIAGVPFLELTSGNSLYRGTGQGSTNTWYQPMNNNLPLKLKVQDFINVASCTTSGDKKTCTKKVSVNRCFYDAYGGIYLNPSTDGTHVCYGDDSTITVEIPTMDAKSKFGAYSWVSSSETAEKQTHNPDTNVSDTITTDADKVTVNFKHQLGYNGPSPVPSGSTFSQAQTNWNVHVTKDGSDVTSSAAFTTPNNGTETVSNGATAENWSSWLGQSSIEIDVPSDPGASVKVCSKINYNPKIIGWKESTPGSKQYAMDSATTSGSANSEACITIKKGDEVTEDGGQIRFWSTSTIQTIASSDVVARKYTTDENGNGKVKLRISTDQAHIDVNFWHNMHYVHEARGGGGPMSDSPLDSDEWADDICTEWNVKRKRDPSGTEEDAGNGTYCAKEAGKTNAESNQPYASGDAGDRSKAVQINDGVGIDLNPGDIITVCEKIHYEPEIVTLLRTKKKDTTPNGTALITNYNGQPVVYADGTAYAGLILDRFGWPVDIIDYDADGNPIYSWDQEVYDEFGSRLYEFTYGTHYEYKKDGTSGEGESEACIEVTRPITPNPVTPPSVQGPYSGGNNDSDPMYAGETTNLDWDVEATAYLTRRLMGWNAIVFQVKVDAPFDSSKLKGNIGGTRSNTDPCSWYSSKFNAFLRGGCAAFETRDWTFVKGMPNSESQKKVTRKTEDDGGEKMFVPEYVGDKYCNSFGYRWQYWYGVQYNDGATNWNPDSSVSNYTYWTNYDAACRTIAKKPSVGIWNGGIAVGNGSIRTSTSPRKFLPYVGMSVNDYYSQYDKVFGSWTEHAAVIHDSVIGLASGASYAWTGAATTDLLKNSPLTIRNNVSNVNELGYSGIGINSTIWDRLQTYFMNNADETHSGSYSVGGLTVTDSKIIRVDGDLTITDQIRIPDGLSANSIYQLPQLVFYVNGDININPNVKQIDAWLITPTGRINTCNGVIMPKDTSKNANPGARVNGWGGDTQCSNELKINGPIFAPGVDLGRSYGLDGISNNDTDLAGSSETRAATAEVFNLSMDAYLWAYAQAGRYQSSYTEAYSRELPPRY